MIKSTDLRIGNFILVPKWEKGYKDEDMAICKVESINADGINLKSTCYGGECGTVVGYSDEDIKPIPLTLEMLEKAGFNYDFITHVLEYSINGHVSYLTLTSGNYSWLYDNMLHNIEFYPTREIKYLHQLQNLYFSLASEELEINL